VKAERLRNPDFCGLDHQQEDAYQQQRDDFRMSKANTTQTKYEQLVNEMSAKFPGMSRSDVHTHVQSLYPKEWLEFKGKGGFANTPPDGELSGRPAPRSP
jgi:hypothetical protein